MKNIRLFESVQQEDTSVKEPTYVSYNEQTGLVTCVKPMDGGDEDLLYKGRTITCTIRLNDQEDYFSSPVDLSNPVILCMTPTISEILGFDLNEVGATGIGLDVEKIIFHDADVQPRVLEYEGTKIDGLYFFDKYGTYTYTIVLKEKPKHLNAAFSFSAFYESPDTTLMRVDVSNLDTSDVEEAILMFNHSFMLNEVVGIENLIQGKCVNVSGLFVACYSLESINFGGWDVSNVKNMSAMLTSCFVGFNEGSEGFESYYKNYTLDFTNWDISKVTIMDEAFICGANVIKMGGNPSSLESCGYIVLEDIDGEFWYNDEYDYSKIIAALPENWNAVACVMRNGELVPILA